MSLLNTITRKADRPQAGPRLVIHGEPKIGKSTLGAGFPNPIFLQLEEGIGELGDVAAFPKPDSFQQLLEQLDTLCAEDHGFETVVIDSLTALERLIWADICKAEGVESIELAAGGFGKGYNLAANDFQRVYRRTDYLSQVKGMTIIGIAHSKLVTVYDPTLSIEGINCQQLALHAPKSGIGASNITSQLFDAILFCSQEKMIQSGAAKNETQGKGSRALTTGKRIINCELSPQFAAGNRFGLPATLPLDAKSLIEALNKSRAIKAPSNEATASQTEKASN